MAEKDRSSGSEQSDASDQDASPGGLSRRTLLGTGATFASLVAFFGADILAMPEAAFAAGGYVWPVGRDPLPDSTYGQQFGASRPGGRIHAGADFLRPSGTSIGAVTDGVVGSKGYQADSSGTGAGNYLYINHTGFTSVYFHMLTASPLVQGTRVVTGQEVGRVGNTGTGVNHLHLEIRENGTALDPVPYLQARVGTATAPPTPTYDGDKMQLIQSPTTIAIIGSNPGLGAANARTLGTAEQVNAAAKAWGQPVILTQREYDVVRALATNTPVN